MSKYAEIRAKITELQKQADEIYVSEKKAAIADIKDKLKTYGITAAEIGLEKKPVVDKPSKAASVKKAAAAKPARKSKATAKPSAAQFVGPNGETWGGGRGKRPAWVNAILAAGGDMEQYRVK
ncbi:H-NS histone family protein [Gammaproteobacteria bacterium LSUCC0112]|nr:H-NS histone family protein [Gammaproteobacteria bacterium LSUCC0112]